MAIDAGQLNFDLFSKFQKKFNRDPNAEEMQQFGTDVGIDWNQPISQDQYDQALGWVDTFSPTSPNTGPVMPPTTQTIPDAPNTTLGRIAMPAPFTVSPFVAPTAEDAFNDPGYKFAEDRAMKGVLHGASAAGLTRTPQAREAVATTVGNLASQRYGDVYNRRFNEWLGKLSAEGQAFDRNLGAQIGITGANNQAALAELDPQLSTWEARILAGDRGLERDRLNAMWLGDSRFRQDQADIFNRFRERDWWRTGAWRDEDFAEARRRFLAQMGLA